MSIPFLYIPLLQTINLQSSFSSGGDEGFYISRVLRSRSGEAVMLTDGKGYIAEAEIYTVNKTEVLLHLVKEAVYIPKKDYSIHIAIAPPRHPDRLEWFVEKATETGVDAITLMICEHSEKWNVHHARLNRLMIAAMKQSRQAWLPKLSGPVAFQEFLASSGEQEKWIAYCGMESQSLARLCRRERSSVVAIGPEGDFSPQEVEKAVKNGFIPINLGPSRLRTETAGWVACQTLHVVNQL